jgi:hypothetical protein
LCHRPPVSLQQPGCLEQIAEGLLFLALSLLRDPGLAEAERLLEAMMQRSLVGSRHFTQALEGGAPLRNISGALEQCGP